MPWHDAVVCVRLGSMTPRHTVMPQALWHDDAMDTPRRTRLRQLGRAYRRALDAEEATRKELAAEALAAVADGEPVGEVAREIGFDREWIRRARINAEKAAKAAARPDADAV
jgi:hypothetical protein